MQFATERAYIDESAKRALRRAHEEERKARANGYKNVRIDARTEILVPCDENGNPTAVGKKKIEAMREYLRL